MQSPRGGSNRRGYGRDDEEEGTLGKEEEEEEERPTTRRSQQDPPKQQTRPQTTTSRGAQKSLGGSTLRNFANTQRFGSAEVWVPHDEEEEISEPADEYEHEHERGNERGTRSPRGQATKQLQQRRNFSEPSDLSSSSESERVMEIHDIHELDAMSPPPHSNSDDRSPSQTPQRRRFTDGEETPTHTASESGSESESSTSSRGVFAGLKTLDDLHIQDEIEDAQSEGQMSLDQPQSPPPAKYTSSRASKAGARAQSPPSRRDNALMRSMEGSVYSVDSLEEEAPRPRHMSASPVATESERSLYSPIREESVDSAR